MIDIFIQEKEVFYSPPAHINLGDGFETFINSDVQANFQVILDDAIPNNWDCVFIVFGGEGVGKTTFSSQACRFLDRTFNNVRVVFTPEEFINALESSKEEDAILWDEAITGASTSTQANKLSFFIVSQLTQIRKKKLKLFFCFPYLNMLNKYFVMRCRGGFYIYAKSFKQRGFGKFYSQKRMSLLYGYMKEKYSYYPNQAIKFIEPNYDFTFSKLMCLDVKDYDEKKEEARKKLKEDFFSGGIAKDGEKKCNHPTGYIRTRKREGTWYCLKCGKVWDENPFNTTNKQKG